MQVHWYSFGLRFQCQGCGNCCLDQGEKTHVYFSAADVEAASQFLNRTPEDFFKAFCEWDDEFIQLKPTGTKCIFLQEGTCRIYPARPRQCAAFPFWTENLSIETWRRLATYCPGIGRGRRYTAEEIQRIARERDDWYAGS